MTRVRVLAFVADLHLVAVARERLKLGRQRRRQRGVSQGTVHVGRKGGVEEAEGVVARGGRGAPMGLGSLWCDAKG